MSSDLSDEQMDMSEGPDIASEDDGPPLPTLSEILAIKNASDAEFLYDLLLPFEERISEDFWTGYTLKEVLIGFQACLALYSASNRRFIPREFQLKAIIALCTGKDTLIDVGTGYGKTLCMIVTMLLSPEFMALVVTPLKKLQEQQVKEFSKYGLSTIGINEDTPNDAKLWEDIASGKYSVLIVQAEQLFVARGHTPRLARLFNKRRDFTRRIRYLFVDEAHHIYVSGTALYGLPAFRPAWAFLGQLRTKLGSDTVVAALSGTMPTHIKLAVKECLQLDDDNLCSIKLSCNRPNIAYAMHGIAGSTAEYRNLDFVIWHLLGSSTTTPGEGRRRKKGIIFHDSLEGAVKAKIHQNRLLPADKRNTGIIKVYHSQMSDEYLQKTYDDFCDAKGVCEILHATESASTGLDNPNVDFVVQYGLPREMTNTQQRAGRCGRDGQPAIYVLMYEDWTLEADLSKALEDAEKSRTALDPDRPVKGKLDPKKRNNKHSRTGVSMLQLVQHREEICIRSNFAQSNNDDSPKGEFCCNSPIHKEKKFDFSQYFAGKLLYKDPATEILYRGEASDPDRKALVEPTAKRTIDAVVGKSRAKYRKPKERPSLISRIDSWRYQRWRQDPFRALQSPHFILSDKDITRLAMIPHSNIESAKKDLITATIGASKDWEEKYAEELLGILNVFDDELADLEGQVKRARDEARKRARVAKEAQNIIDTFADDHIDRATRVETQLTSSLQLTTEQVAHRITHLDQLEIELPEIRPVTPRPTVPRPGSKPRKKRKTKSKEEVLRETREAFEAEARETQARAEAELRERLLLRVQLAQR